jgi:hypothetical protein
MTLEAWVTAAKRDAERRGLPQLPPLLDTLRSAMERLRAADWNDDLRGGPSKADDRRTGGGSSRA